MSERQCPVCKGDVYLNPDMVLYISPCFHKLCESCVNRVFNKGQAPCPECGTVLRKINYITPTFEDVQVERECKIRKMLKRVFGREEEDFCGNGDEYDEYLEKFEELVFELLEMKNEFAVRERIREVEEMGRSSILNPVTGVFSNRQAIGVRGRRKMNVPAEEEERKVLRADTSSYFDPENLPRIFITPKKTIYFPPNLLKIYKHSGLTHQMVFSIAISSLNNRDI